MYKKQIRFLTILMFLGLSSNIFSKQLSPQKNYEEIDSDSVTTFSFEDAVEISAPQETRRKKDQWVTIFIHGSFSLKPHLSLTNMMNMLYDTLEESVYHRATEINRRDPFYHKNQAMLGFGLQKISIHEPNKNEAARILGYAFEQMSQKAGNSPSDEYYAYGWSGLVSHKLRYIEAEHLYKDLLRLKAEYGSQGINPKIRIVSYSHGGNLALQLGAIFVTQPRDKKVHIDELFFLGTPIQVETDYLVNSPAFKRIYNIYSRKDSVQRLDFFSFKRFFSKQKFTNRRNFEVPSKVTQYRIQVNNYTPKNPDLAATIGLPHNKRERKKLFKLNKYAPGHFELWFMGWTLLTFRQDFPLNPLPIAAFLPLLTFDHEKHPELSHDLTLDINTTEETITFVDRAPRYRRNKPTLVRPFISQKELAKIQKHVWQFEAIDYDLETYNAKTAHAITIAKQERRSLKKLRKSIEKKYQSREYKGLSKKEILEQEQAISIDINNTDIPYLGHL